MNYYTAVIIICWLSLAVLCILVRENARLERSHKRIFYISYLLIAVAALAEWLADRFTGNDAVPMWFLMFLKCADFILTPMSSIAFVEQMGMKNIWEKVLRGLIAANTVFQVICGFTGWTVTIDGNNDIYDGALYPIYIAICLAAIALLIVEFVLYGMEFKKHNRGSFYGIIIVVLAGIALQELSGGTIWTTYLGMTVSAALLFIHLTEFHQLESDEHIMEQHILITTDALTGLSSRHAYSRTLNELKNNECLADDIVVFSLDINGLKQANDTYGHEAGDELIQAAAGCIRDVFGSDGECYRTGGDEFIVIAEMSRCKAESALEELKNKAALWHGEKVSDLTIAAGFALAQEHKGLSIEKLVYEADMAMYKAKSEYYSATCHDRRHV